MKNVEKGSFQEEKERNKGETYSRSFSKFTGKKRGLSKIKSQKPKKTKKKSKKKTEKKVQTDKSKFQELLQILINEESNCCKKEEKDLIIIKPLNKYVKEKEEEWKKGKENPYFDMEKFAKSIGIINNFNFTFLKKYIQKDIDIFIKYFPYFHLSLTIQQRKEIQKEIKDKCNLPIITNNYVGDNIKSVKDIFYNLCISIINLNLNDVDDENFEIAFKNVFLTNKVYSEKHFESLIPVEFGNVELKFNKLIFDVIDFFYYKYTMNNEIKDNKKLEIDLIKEKLDIFKKLKPFFEKFDKFDNDEELLTVCHYLLFSLHILFYVSETKRDYENFEKIILCCLPFEIEKARKTINDLKSNFIKFTITIDNVNIKKFDIDNLKSDSKINFGIKELETKVKDVNWNLGSDKIKYLLISDSFMYCFRFPKISEINFLYINETIRNNYKKLFKKIIQSEIMEKYMNLDVDAKCFNYPFKNDEIFDEIEKKCYLVPFPAKNFYGISDRASLIIYINSFIDSSNFKTLFTDIDKIAKSKCHEIKHIFKLYMDIYKPEIELKTPIIKGLNKNNLTKDYNRLFRAKRKVINYVYTKKCISENEMKNLDYGDILEYDINRNKQEVFLIKNSFFCLSESTWDLHFNEFTRKYFETCFDMKFLFKRKKDCDFINSVIDYFKLRTNINCINDAITSKRTTKINRIETLLNEISNEGYHKPREKHFTLH